MTGPWKKSSFHRVKDTRKYHKGKEGKTDEIKRALGHRASLRREYFKLIEKEGGETGKQEEGEEDNNGYKQNVEDEEKEKPKKQLTYPERVKLNRERKEKTRRERLEHMRERVNKIKKSVQKREHKKEVMKKAKTRRGQPLMGPRIENLLEKIKADTK